jgi:hypothetical protein
MKKLSTAFALMSIFALSESAFAAGNEIRFKADYIQVNDVTSAGVEGFRIKNPNLAEQACNRRQKKVAEQVFNEPQYHDFLKAGGVNQYFVTVAEVKGYKGKKKWHSALTTDIFGGDHIFQITILRDGKCVDYSEADLRNELDTLIVKSAAIHLNPSEVISRHLYMSYRTVDSNQAWADVTGIEVEGVTSANGIKTYVPEPGTSYTLTEQGRGSSSASASGDHQ